MKFLAIVQDGRNAYLMEFDPRYVDIIIDRWEKFTGGNCKINSRIILRASKR